jgi:hypothetical protein
MFQRLPQNFFVPLHLAPVRGLHQDAHLHRPHLPLIHAVFFHLVARAGRPGKIVNVVAVIGQSWCCQDCFSPTFTPLAPTTSYCGTVSFTS